MISTPDPRAAEALRSLVAMDHYGGIVSDPRRLRGALADLCPGLPTEAFVLTTLMRAGLPAELVDVNQAESVLPMAHRAARAAEGAFRRTGLDRAWASWGAVAWAEALAIEVDLAAVLRPHILRFEADPDVETGVVRLSWETVGSPDLVLLPDRTDVSGRSTAEVHQRSGVVDYVLRASNKAGRSERGVRVSLPAPLVESFEASPRVRTRAGKSTVRWSARYSSRVTIDGVPISGGTHEVDVPAEGATVTLVAHGAGQEVRATCRIDVAQIVRFEPVRTSLGLFLEWSAAHVDHVLLDGVGAFGAQGRHPIGSPTMATRYTLRAVTASGATVRRTITVSLPKVGAFSVEPAVAYVGTDITFRWQVSKAKRVTIDGIGDVTGKRSLTVGAKAGGTYTLRAEGPWGATSRTVVVDVRRRPSAPHVPLVRVQSEAPQYPVPSFEAPFRGGPGVVDLADRVRDLTANPSPRTPAEAFRRSFQAARSRLLSSVRSASRLR